MSKPTSCARFEDETVRRAVGIGAMAKECAAVNTATGRSVRAFGCRRRKASVGQSEAANHTVAAKVLATYVGPPARESWFLGMTLGFCVLPNSLIPLPTSSTCSVSNGRRRFPVRLPCDSYCVSTALIDVTLGRCEGSPFVGDPTSKK